MFIKYTLVVLHVSYRLSVANDYDNRPDGQDKCSRPMQWPTMWTAMGARRRHRSSAQAIYNPTSNQTLTLRQNDEIA